jgi:hypothetical protein
MPLPEIKLTAFASAGRSTLSTVGIGTIDAWPKRKSGCGAIQPRSQRFAYGNWLHSCPTEPMTGTRSKCLNQQIWPSSPSIGKAEFSARLFGPITLLAMAQMWPVAGSTAVTKFPKA